MTAPPSKLAGPPILPWLRKDSTQAKKKGYEDVRVIEAVSRARFPELRLAQDKPRKGTER
jgi:hypothetical protein